MSGYAEKTMDKMSDGECQRIMIARALAQDTPVILLDEPTAFLDSVSYTHLSKKNLKSANWNSLGSA